jgi:16S rRNA (uracil1498-N3)-methyltransferase
MCVPRIYTQQELGAETQLTLEPAPSHHISRVLRMDAGDSLILFNGKGGEYPATINTLDKKSVLVTTQQHNPRDLESPLRLELGIALSRGDRFDWVIQKATELGVTSIAPLITERTEVRLKADRIDKKQQHWRQVIISACEQSGRNRPPELQTVVNLGSWLPQVTAQRKFVLHHRDTSAAESHNTPSSVALLIGPEGGLSAEEITAAGKAGFEALTLGPRIMRTETAPLAALAILQAKWGDMPLET